MNTALCWKRLTRLLAEMKTWFGLMISKTTTMMTSARMTGSSPLSPLRTRRVRA